MFKPYRFISFLLAAVLLISVSASAATVWTANEAALPVPHTYGGSDWIGYISFGQSFELIQTKDDYAQLRNDKGSTGWVARENLVYFDPNYLNQVMYVQSDGNILWPQAQYEDEPIQLKKDDMVHVVGITPHKEWYRVEYKNKYYYTPYILLGNHPAPEQGPGLMVKQRYVFGRGIDLYGTDDETTEPIASISDFTSVRLLETKGHMSKIRVDDNLVGFTQTINLIRLELY